MQLLPAILHGAATSQWGLPLQTPIAWLDTAVDTARHCRAQSLGSYAAVSLFLNPDDSTSLLFFSRLTPFI